MDLHLTSDSTAGVKGAELISGRAGPCREAAPFPKAAGAGGAPWNLQGRSWEGATRHLGGSGACLWLEGEPGESFVKGLTMHVPGRADIPGGEPCEAAAHGLWA